MFKARFFTNYYSTVNINSLNTDSSRKIQLYPNIMGTWLKWQSTWWNCKVIILYAPVVKFVVRSAWMELSVISCFIKKTRHPVQGPFGSEFPTICNHCGVMTAWSRKTWKFLEKRPLSNCRYCADRAQNLPGTAPTFGLHCSRFHPNRFTLGGVIAERLKTVFARLSIYNIGSSSL